MFYGEMWLIISKLSLLPLLLWSTGFQKSVILTRYTIKGTTSAISFLSSFSLRVNSYMEALTSIKHIIFFQTSFLKSFVVQGSKKEVTKVVLL